MNKNTAKRSCTAGIPDFVPRKSTTDTTHLRQAKSTYYVPDTPEQTLPPVTPCFSQADIDEFLARKPEKYKMTERDYKELGRNIFLGTGSLILGAIKGAILVDSIIPKNKSSNRSRGWGYNSKGQYGYYGSHNWGVTFDK
ncbi:TPA: hypothetical protein ACGT9I_001364 [Salmonella enterica]|nr:hypothetical protein [Salmonella enterica subsp. enterica]ECW0837332.1 hypothetical protein [Salmonella enterica subsp. enterica]HEC7107873.1 hypothetical protein [Salmonella enterica subsp. enterica serovar Mississippi]